MQAFEGVKGSTLQHCGLPGSHHCILAPATDTLVCCPLQKNAVAVAFIKAGNGLVKLNGRSSTLLGCLSLCIAHILGKAVGDSSRRQ